MNDDYDTYDYELHDLRDDGFVYKVMAGAALLLAVIVLLAGLSRPTATAEAEEAYGMFPAASASAGQI
jgi:hypothetical protein